MKRITVLGAGMVGSAIIRDLAEEFHVVAVDANSAALERVLKDVSVKTITADIEEQNDLANLVGDSDLVVSAVPGFMGFETVKRIIETGKNVVDISFFPEDAFELDELAKTKGVTAVVDCGVAPGLCNMLAGHVSTQLDKLTSYKCYVGGLPVERTWPFEYKAVFSPIDVLEEYTRPVRYMENGQLKVCEPLSGMEMIDISGLGTLEAFNTDGLRTLIRTLPMPFMIEKTLRYPGHANLMRVFKHCGFFDTDPIAINGQQIRPMDVTSQLLFKQWRMKPNELDMTVMRVVVEGTSADSHQRYTWELLDGYDSSTGTTSMARTTGYTCAIVARQVLSGMFQEKGICPPEIIGQNQACFDHLMDLYQERNIHITKMVETLSPHPI